MDRPKYKKDYPGKRIRLLRAAPVSFSSFFIEGIEAKILRRVKAEELAHSAQPVPGDPSLWWLKIEARCPCCGLVPVGYVPEAWIDEGLIEFLG